MSGSDGKPRGIKEYVDGLARRVAALEKRVDKHASLLLKGAKLELALEKRVDALDDARLERDGVIGPGYHPLRHQSAPSCIEDGPGINLSPDAEPPGSPTVEEAEDRPIDLTPEQQKRIAVQWWQQVREAVEAEGPVRASDWLRDLDEERGHPDQKRRECWEVRRHDGTVWIPGYRATKQESDRILSEGEYLASQHRMVELRDGEGIWEDDVMSRFRELERENAEFRELCEAVILERDRLKASVAELVSILKSTGCWAFTESAHQENGSAAARQSGLPVRARSS